MKQTDNFRFVGSKNRQFYNKTASEHLCVKSMNALFYLLLLEKTKKEDFNVNANKSREKISLTNYEELLAVPTIEGASDIPLDQLHEFKGHPFHVVDDEAVDELVESIKAKGVLSPAIARKRPDGGFELISGHRRTHAARREVK